MKQNTFWMKTMIRKFMKNSVSGDTFTYILRLFYSDFLLGKSFHPVLFSLCGRVSLKV